nr:hypothetical protein GCM10020063_009690 [Dactylosporangium thailandense]
MSTADAAAAEAAARFGLGAVAEGAGGAAATDLVNAQRDDQHCAAPIGYDRMVIPS